MSACQKNEDLQKESTENNKMEATIRSDIAINPPSIIDSLAVFSDSAHFFSFYEQLDDLYDEDIESFYDFISNHLSFNSVGKLLEADTLLSSLEDKYNPLIMDEVMRYVLNPYYEFQIGNDLITYLNYDQIVVSDISDNVTRAEIRAIEKDGSFIPIEMIPDSAFWGPAYEPSSFARTICGCNISIRELGCGDVRVWGRCSNVLGGRGKGTVHYQNFPIGFGPATWPDYGPLPFFNEEEVRGNFSFTFSISEPREVYARATPNCVLGVKRFANEEVEVNNTCDYKTRSSDWMWHQYTTFGVAVSMKLRHYRDWRFDRVSIEVVAYKYYGPGDWRQENINYLYSRIEADFKDRNSCHFWYHDSAQHSCSNCRRSSRRIKNPRRSTAFCDGDLRGYAGGLVGTNLLWEVSGTLEGFECCE
ncbi:MAG: hypothetical protein EA409_00325 [Saprospirales bacterium]|nr:MAG: hypothetical protein EA409_00325 [Saprospirales bacterium]